MERFGRSAVKAGKSPSKVCSKSEGPAHRGLVQESLFCMDVLGIFFGRCYDLPLHPAPGLWIDGGPWAIRVQKPAL